MRLPRGLLVSTLRVSTLRKKSLSLLLLCDLLRLSLSKTQFINYLVLRVPGMVLYYSTFYWYD